MNGKELIAIFLAAPFSFVARRIVVDWGDEYTALGTLGTLGYGYLNLEARCIRKNSCFLHEPGSLCRIFYVYFQAISQVGTISKGMFDLVM